MYQAQILFFIIVSSADIAALSHELELEKKLLNASRPFSRLGYQVMTKVLVQIHRYKYNFLLKSENYFLKRLTVAVKGVRVDAYSGERARFAKSERVFPRC